MKNYLVNYFCKKYNSYRFILYLASIKIIILITYTLNNFFVLLASFSIESRYFGISLI